MKKHQKVLLGIMALSLAGGTGTAIALNFEAASSSQTVVPTDDAIYLYWGLEDQDSKANVQVKDFVKGVAQYRPLVVAPKSSANVEGWVKISFTLTAEDPSAKTNGTTNYSLPGVTVNVYEVSGLEFTSGAESYTYSNSYTKDETNLKATLAMTSSDSSKEDWTCFKVDKSDSVHETTKYYTLEFVWDGTSVDKDHAFGGNLAISQSFEETEPTKGQ